MARRVASGGAAHVRSVTTLSMASKRLDVSMGSVSYTSRPAPRFVRLRAPR